MQKRGEFVEQLLAEGVRVDKLNERYLEGRYDLQNELGAGSPAMQRLIKLDGRNDISFADLAYQFESRDDVGRMAKLVENGASARQLSSPTIEKLMTLSRALTPDLENTKRIIKLERAGLDCDALSQFVHSGPPEDTTLVNVLIARGFTVKQLGDDQLTHYSLLQEVAKNSKSISEIIPRLEEADEHELKDLLRFLAVKPGISNTFDGTRARTRRAGPG